MTKQVPSLQSTLPLFLAALAAAAAIGCADAAQTGLMKSVWTPICKTSEELGEIAGEALHDANSILEHVKTMRIAAMRSGIYAIKNIGTTKQLKGTLLQEYYDRRARTALNHYKEQAAHLQLDAAAKASYLKGRVDEYLSLLERATQGTNACLLQTDRDGQAAARAGGLLQGEKCELKPPPTTSAKRVTKTIEAGGFTALKANDGKEAAAQPTQSSKKCLLLSTVNTNGYGADGAATAGAIEVMAGYLKIPHTDSKLTLTTASKLHTTESGSHEAWTAAHTAIQKQTGTAHEACRNETAEAKDRQAIKHAITRLYGEKAPAEESIVASKLTLILGDKTADKLAAAEHEVNKEEIPAGIAGRPTEATLGQINDEDELTSLLAYYQTAASRKITELKQQLKEASGQKDPKTTADVCNKIKDESECNNKAFCSYNESAAEEDKKCKYNATKATSNGVPVAPTQTESAEKTTEKCKGKLEPECTKAPECKWDGKECKDYIFLVNKKLALTMVSGFVSLVAF
uniref:Variant surface glycoprotein 1125.4098 n=1 Tax=Trypanosoma brucei TaxID=5691 RepID=A0A1J0R9Z8_9TRYP|nr:variant surface glycoprotein 1125.4098 [Trypanosoma brucei]